jgi:hypothetical protein
MAADTPVKKLTPILQSFCGGILAMPLFLFYTENERIAMCNDTEQARWRMVL